ncbi:MAG TPA: hypothetical protein PLD99_01185 [Parcubacteria group bacterium]|nr:hypothetical protein [Parcubacteria group bacterium]
MWKQLTSLILLVLVFTIVAGVAWFVDYYAPINSSDSVVIGDVFPTKEPEEGQITLKIGESGVFRNISIKPTEVVQDSRCPVNVNCIWAGTLKVKVEVYSGLGASTPTIELGGSITTEAEEIKLVSVSPEKMQGETLANDYKFVFEVTKRAQAPIGAKGCFVAGCSSQICSDKEEMVSTCEFRAEYACYRSAKCERQASGQCGWTDTSELRMCLNNPPAL